LPGITLANEIEERKKNRRLYKPEGDDDLLSKFQEGDEAMEGMDTKRAFKDH